MDQRHLTGAYGEQIAEDYLKKLDYKILEKNFACKQGEIDLVALDKNEIVIIEVKTRTNIYYGKPAESVGIIKQKHMYNAAKYYVHIRNFENDFIRFDVVEVYLTQGRARINHIKQVI